MTSLETLIAVQRLGKLGILEGLQVTEAFSKHIAHHLKSTSIDSMNATAAEYGITDSEGIIGASLILSFCHWNLPEEYDLKSLVKALTDVRNYAIKEDDLNRLKERYKNTDTKPVQILPSPEEFKVFDEAARVLKEASKLEETEQNTVV